MRGEAGERLCGLHSYEGHLREVNTAACERGYALVHDAVMLLKAAQHPIRHVITSGSDTFATALKSPALQR